MDVHVFVVLVGTDPLFSSVRWAVLLLLLLSESSHDLESK